MRHAAAAFGVLAGLLAAFPAAAFRNVTNGAPISDRTMRTLDGKRAPLLQADKVNVIVFVRTGQDHSESALRQLAQLAREVEAKPVRFAAIVSDGEPPEEVRKLAEACGGRMPILVDDQDALYGELGVAMHPSTGIIAKDRRLVGFQPFRKVNFLDAMRGQVKLALGEIDEAALAKILDPGVSSAPAGGRARARLKLARTLLAAGSVDAAIENARAGIALEPELGDAHLALAEALAKGGRCEDSVREVAAARRLAADAAIAAPPCPAR